eukprot:TRINITY_DN14522_c0_g1_i1.p1 TRINITY_DN14522_c0_g1~~TRINITY_DN14522_c0_g1_i1.p1  ORF type:complete len:315 (-),score=17.60 TRINITY_DN14522_c0_g1_i1:261-1175(-)
MFYSQTSKRDLSQKKAKDGSSIDSEASGRLEAASEARFETKTEDWQGFKPFAMESSDSAKSNISQPEDEQVSAPGFAFSVPAPIPVRASRSEEHVHRPNGRHNATPVQASKSFEAVRSSPRENGPAVPQSAPVASGNIGFGNLPQASSSTEEGGVPVQPSESYQAADVLMKLRTRPTRASSLPSVPNTAVSQVGHDLASSAAPSSAIVAPVGSAPGTPKRQRSGVEADEDAYMPRGDAARRNKKKKLINKDVRIPNSCEVHKRRHLKCPLECPERKRREALQRAADAEAAAQRAAEGQDDTDDE